MQLKVDRQLNYAQLTIFLEKPILLFVDKEIKLLSVADVAKKLGVTRRRINQLIDKNKLPAQRIGRSFVILEEDLKLVENRQPGRPPKEKGVDGKSTEK